MPEFEFTHYSEKQFNALPQSVQIRILEKLKQLKNHPDFRSIAKTLVNLSPATHRIRIGKYRILLEKINEEKYLILKLAERSQIYR